MFGKQLHAGVLFVRDGEYPYLPILWQHVFDPFDMRLRILGTRTMTHIYGELEHNETVLNQFFSEFCGRLPFLFGLCRQIKEDKYPHNPVFAETIHFSLLRGR